MKRGILPILLMLVFCSVTLLAETFYKDLNQAQRFELSQAYLAVSEHYNDLGDETRASSYRGVADMLLASIAEAPQRDGSENNTAGDSSSTESPVTEEKPVDQRTIKAIQYYFNKTGSAILAENVDKTVEGLAFPLTVGSYTTSEMQVREDLNTLINEYDITGYTLDYVWDLENATFRWMGDDVVMTLPTKVYDPGIFLFWDDPQDFRFTRADRGWKLSGIE